MRVCGIVDRRHGRQANKCTDTPEMQGVARMWLGATHTKGTLNVRVCTERDRNAWLKLRDGPWRKERQPTTHDPTTPVLVLRAELEGYGRVVAVALDSPWYPKDLLELLAPDNLQQRNGLADGDPVTLEFPSQAAT